MDGFTYDVSGNLLNDGAHSYTYDAEDRITKVDGGTTATYTYDALGHRVLKTTPSDSMNYVYDQFGHEVAEAHGSQSGWYRGDVYAAGRHLATYTNSPTYSIHADWLGTERARTGVTGSVIETCQSLPYGDGQSCTGSDISPKHFTGKMRDTETGLDYFGARYHASALGRFMTPDQAADDTIPVALPWADLRSPQSLNLYTFALNNPVSNVDPDGHDVHVCVDNDKGGQNCLNLTDPQYVDLYRQQNGRQGINLPGGNFPTGNITCGGQACGSAAYFEPGLESDNLVNLAIGGLFNTAIEGGVGTLEGLFGSGARTAAGEAAAGEEVLVKGSKATIRDALENGAVNEIQKQAVKRALARGAAADTYTIEKLADGSIRVIRTVAGRAGGRAIYESVVDAAGNTLPGSAVQKAYDAAGNLVHYDPKN